MAISIPAQSRALPPLDGDHRWWVLKSAARCTKGVETTSKKKLLITTNSNSKSRLASSYSSQLRKASVTRNTRRKKSQQGWFPEGAARGKTSSVIKSKQPPYMSSIPRELLNVKKQRKCWFFVKNFKSINCSSKVRQQMVKLTIR